MASPLDSSQLGASLLSQAGIAGSSLLPPPGTLTTAPGTAPKPILSGKMVKVVSPLGEAGEIPAEQIQEAQAEGYTLDNPNAQAVREYVAANKGLSGQAKVALGQFADEALFGIPEIIHEKTQDPLESAKWEALKKEHAYANTAGGLGGFAASLLVGGPLFKGAAAAGKGVEGAILAERLAAAGAEQAVAHGVARKALAGAAKLGTEAAIVAAPTAITEAALGDPEEAAETMLWNFGAGAALGTLSPVAKELFAKAVKGSVLAPGGATKLESYANEQAIKSLDPYKRISDRLAETVGGKEGAGEVIRERGLVRRVGEGFEDLVGRIEEEKKLAGDAIGEIYTRLDKAGVTFDPEMIERKMREDVLKPLGEKVGYRAQENKVAKYIEDFAEKKVPAPDLITGEIKKRPLAPGELLGIRQDLDRLIYGEKLPSPEQVDKELKGIRDIYKESLNGAVHEHLGPEIGAKLDKLNNEFRVMSIIEDGAQKNVGRDLTNRTNGLTDYLTGVATSNVGGLIGHAIGGPLGGVVGGMGSQLLGMLGNKYFRQNYNSLAVMGAEKLGILLGEQSMKRVALEFDRIPTLFSEMKGEVAKASPVDAMAKLLGEHAPTAANDTLTKLEQFEKLSKLLSEAVTNGPKTTELINKLTGALAEGGAPEVAAKLAEKQLATIQYLFEKMPKAPAPKPFAPTAKWTPSPAQIVEWEARVEVAANPMAALRHLQQGTLTRAHVETLQVVYPKLYLTIQRRIGKLAAEPNGPVLSYRHRAAVRALVGAVQEGTKAPPAPPEKPVAPPGGGGKMAAAEPTDVQRISG